MGRFFKLWMEAMGLEPKNITSGLPKGHIRFDEFKPVFTRHEIIEGLMEGEQELSGATESRLCEFTGMTKEELKQ